MYQSNLSDCIRSVSLANRIRIKQVPHVKRDYGQNPRADLQLQYTLHKIIQADWLVLHPSRDMCGTAQYGYPENNSVCGS
jgi:hypothetical protein